MKLSQMAAEAAANYEYDIIMAKVNGKLTEIQFCFRAIKEIYFSSIIVPILVNIRNCWIELAS